MNLSRRIKILWICIWMNRARTSLTILQIDVLGKLVKMALSVGRAKETRRIEAITKAADNLRERANSVISELQTLDRFTEDRKRQVLAAKASLMEEHSYLLTVCRNWVCTSPPGATVLTFVLYRAQINAVRRQRSWNGFSRIVSRISSDNFYWDLLLWLCGCSEAMLGDLNEEYLLRIASDGGAGARAWYCSQAVTTIRDYLWMKIEHLAAVGALIELVGRWFRK
jgi:hypothetical protein